MTKPELIDTLITSAYDAVLHEASWAPVLERLAVLTGSNSCAYVTIDGPLPEIVEEYGFDPAVTDEYNRHYAAFDPFHGAILRKPRSLPLIDRQVVSADFVKQSSWFQDFMPRHHLYTMLVLPLFRDGELVGSFNTQKFCGQGDFSADEFAAMQAVTPHLIKAAQLSTKMSGLRQSVAYSEAMLDRLGLPLLLTDEAGKVLLVNRAAELLIAREPALRLQQGTFSVHGSDGTRTPRRSAHIVEMSIPRGGARKPLRLTMLPVSPHSAVNSLWQRPMMMIVIDDPETIPVGLTEILQGLFSMTAAEARVCVALACEGLSPQSCADVFGVSITTIRSQIRSIYSKTGVKRQMELVRMLTMLGATRGTGR